MPEARDRVARQENVMAVYSRRQIAGGGNRNSEVFILEDDVDSQATRTPFRWRDTPMVGTPGPMVVAARRRGGLGSPRIWRTPYFGGSSSKARGKENMSPVVGSGRGRRGLRRRGSTLLPAWYPRKPLRDVTAIVRAIERRREREREGEGLETESPTSVAQLEQDPSVTTPVPMIGTRRCPPTIGKVPKILLNITNQSNEDPTCLTPQKKLLNNLETVEKVVTEELHKLKTTPSAKKAERQKKVRTLMSMR